jgi:rSAM/selenodomain-associated transferase 2
MEVVAHKSSIECQGIPILSVIIPSLNESGTIGTTIERLNELAGISEIIVVDGGSIDETGAIAAARGATVIKSQPGRGRQLSLGASIAKGQVLWFLHADTIPLDDSAQLIEEILRDPSIIGGNFRVRFSGPSIPARFMTWLYPKLRMIGLFYGDSAIFVRRSVYERAGGFNSYQIFEDLDLIRRLRREGRMAQLSAEVITSSRRFEGKSFTLTFLRWASLQLLYWLGVNPNRLAGLYR